ncbi:MAG: Trk system potassium transporter TrkA [Bacteroidales bacterium]|nr:Trk system potassium transporter TrkA [Bacteroidales bacterium]
MKITIVGAGSVGSHLAKMLRSSSNEITVIDDDKKRLQQLASMADVVTVEGHPTSVQVLKDSDVANADLFVAVYPRSMQDVNVLSALVAKKLGAAKVIARINDEDYLTSDNKLLFKEMGIELMFYPEKIASDEIVDNLRHSTRTETMDFAHGKLQVAIFKLEEESQVLDMQLAEFAAMVKQDSGVSFRVIAISRNGKTVIPRFDTKFQYHDLVYVIAKREGIPALMRYFGENSSDVNKVMIYGGGPIAEMVARSLSTRISSVKLLESDKDKCIELSERLEKVQVSHGDARNSDFLLEEGIKDYNAFVALTDNDETNILACVAARRFGVERTIAEVENIEYAKLAEDLGVDVVINKKLITAGRIFRFTLSGKARFVKYVSGTEAEILEYTVAQNSRITKTELKNMNFPSNAIIGGVIRGNDSFIAVGDTVIEAYDRVVVFASEDTVKEVDAFFR